MIQTDYGYYFIHKIFLQTDRQTGIDRQPMLQKEHRRVFGLLVMIRVGCGWLWLVVVGCSCLLVWRDLNVPFGLLGLLASGTSFFFGLLFFSF